MLKKWDAPSRKREEGTFSVVRKTATETRRRSVVIALVATALGGWLYVFLGSGFFRITDIQTGELIYASREEVSAAAFEAIDAQGKWPWTRRSILFIDIPKLEQELSSKLYAEKVTVEKQYPHILRLNVQERQSSVIVIANKEFYLVDRHGMGVERISSEEEAAILQRIADPSVATSRDLPVLTVNDAVQFEPGERFVSEWTVEGWLQAFEALREASFGYRQAQLDVVTSTKLILDLYEPYEAYFDLLAPMEPQINGFYAFMKAKDTETVINEYIDVRVPGKIYYK